MVARAVVLSCTLLLISPVQLACRCEQAPTAAETLRPIFFFAIGRRCLVVRHQRTAGPPCPREPRPDSGALALTIAVAVTVSVVSGAILGALLFCPGLTHAESQGNPRAPTEQWRPWVAPTELCHTGSCHTRSNSYRILKEPPTKQWRAMGGSN